MKLPYYTFSALADGTIFGVMRTNTNDLELSSDILQVTFHETDNEHVKAANENKSAYRLQQDSTGAVQLVKKETLEEETNDTPALIETDAKEAE